MSLVSFFQIKLISHRYVQYILVLPCFFLSTPETTLWWCGAIKCRSSFNMNITPLKEFLQKYDALFGILLDRCLRLVNPFLFTLKLMSDCDSYNKFIDRCQFQFLLGTKLLFSASVAKQVIHLGLCAFMYGCVLITLCEVTDVKMPH